jgi:hypothetical protein
VRRSRASRIRGSQPSTVLESFPKGFMIELLMRVNPLKVGKTMEILRPLGANMVSIDPIMTVQSRGGAPDAWRAWAWVSTTS